MASGIDLGAWELYKHFRAKIETCSTRGAKGQMLNFLHGLLRAGKEWFISEGIFSQAVSDAIHEEANQ